MSDTIAMLFGPACILIGAWVGHVITLDAYRREFRRQMEKRL